MIPDFYVFFDFSSSPDHRVGQPAGCVQIVLHGREGAVTGRRQKVGIPPADVEGTSALACMSLRLTRPIAALALLPSSRAFPFHRHFASKKTPSQQQVPHTASSPPPPPHSYTYYIAVVAASGDRYLGDKRLPNLSLSEEFHVNDIRLSAHPPYPQRSKRASAAGQHTSSCIWTTGQQHAS